MTPGHTAVDRIRHGLVVSCQAYPGEPMLDPTVMTAIALAAIEGGAVGIRAKGLDDIAMIRSRTATPLIGLVKVGRGGVFITPTVADAAKVAEAGADIVAIDGTARKRPDGRPLQDTVAAVHDVGKLVLADCSCLDDALHSISAGADCLSTTLSGYTDSRPRTTGPDTQLLTELLGVTHLPVIAEGRIRNPEDARRCLDAGAYAVVVGTAITHPTTITRTFVTALTKHG